MSLVTGKAKELFSEHVNGEKFLFYARFSLPLILHCSCICFLDLLYLMPKAIPPDYSSVLIVASVSELLIRLQKLHVEEVDIPHPYVDNFVLIFLTCLYCDLALRYIWIPIEYLIYYLCMHGASIAMLKAIAPFLPRYFDHTLIKLANIAQSKTGCIYAKHTVATIIFIVVFSQSDLFEFLLKLLKRILKKILCLMLKIWELLKLFSQR